MSTKRPTNPNQPTPYNLPPLFESVTEKIARAVAIAVVAYLQERDAANERRRRAPRA